MFIYCLHLRRVRPYFGNLYQLAYPELKEQVSIITCRKYSWHACMHIPDVAYDKGRDEIKVKGTLQVLIVQVELVYGRCLPNFY